MGYRGPIPGRGHNLGPVIRDHRPIGLAPHRTDPDDETSRPWG